jgi:hypothetical protein
MSFSGVGGGFQGGDALLAFAAIQQGRMNEEMSESMRVADLRSQMAGDLADIKAHMEQANQHPERFVDVDKELQAFMDKYGSEPALADVTETVKGIADDINERVTNSAAAGTPIVHYQDNEMQPWLDNITQKLDAAGTNDQLAMIHIKQLNDNINNSSGMVSGIIESRQNSTASIINNIA